MRTALTSASVVAALAIALAAASSPARAEPACGPDKLGVSRVAEIDTTGGPAFGEPFGRKDFLAPGEVVLTFDDGPSPATTRPILAALAEQCTKATFFVVGSMVRAHPEVLKEEVAQGHTVGTHTWSHPNLKRLSSDRAKAQVEEAFTMAEKAAGQPIAPFFRYPYLSEPNAIVSYLRSRNIGQFAIDVDSLDWRYRNVKSVVRRVMAGLAQRGRGIILLHDIHASTAAAVPVLLAELKAHGYKVVHMTAKTPVETLVAYQPPPEASKSHASVRRAGVRHTRAHRRYVRTVSW
ncbi:MAG: polysaccharide deacetylase family protein [Hyphomicrobiaceae bacterium]